MLALVVGVAFALGFDRRPARSRGWRDRRSAGAVRVALVWLAIALGLAAKSVETASNTPMFLTLLPFLGSGFVLISTLPAGLRQFARVPTVHAGHPRPCAACSPDGPIGAHAVGGGRLEPRHRRSPYLWAIRLYDRRTGPADPK